MSCRFNSGAFYSEHFLILKPFEHYKDEINHDIISPMASSASHRIKRNRLDIIHRSIVSVKPARLIRIYTLIDSIIESILLERVQNQQLNSNIYNRIVNKRRHNIFEERDEADENLPNNSSTPQPA
jgi:hypothetical protein